MQKHTRKSWIRLTVGKIVRRARHYGARSTVPPVHCANFCQPSLGKLGRILAQSAYSVNFVYVRVKQIAIRFVLEMNVGPFHHLVGHSSCALCQ